MSSTPTNPTPDASTPDKRLSDVRSGHSTPLRAAGFGVALAAAACWPLVLSQSMRGRGASDQVNYHEKVIRTFAEQLPAPDFSDYLSATTPGYHVLLAGVARVLSDGRVALQLAGSLFTLGLVALVAGCGASWTGSARRGVLLALPLVCSLYVVSAGVWLLPDNAAWLCVAALLALLLRSGSRGTIIAAGAVLVALVMFRQIHVWAAGVVWAAAWVSGSLVRAGTPAPADERAALFHPADLLPERARAWLGRVALGFGATVPAAALLGWFYQLWGGHLTPPTFVGWYSPGIQWATPAFVLSLVGIVGVFHAGWLWPLAGHAWRAHRVALVVAVGLGVLAAGIPETTYSFEAGRFSGIWTGVRAGPVLGGRTSVVLLALAPLGAACVVLWLGGMDRRRRWIMLAALAGFAAAQCASEQLWQRYHEPFVLIWCAFAVALSNGAPAGTLPASSRFDRPMGAARVLGPLTLAGLLGLVTLLSLAKGAPATDHGFTPGNIEPPPDAGASADPAGGGQTPVYDGRQSTLEGGPVGPGSENRAP